MICGAFHALYYEVRTVRHRRAGYLKLQRDQQARGGAYIAAARQKSYQLAPRATIFRRDAGKVTDLESLKRLMRFNDYQNDPVRHLLSKRCLSIVQLNTFETVPESGQYVQFPAEISVVAAEQALGFLTMQMKACAGAEAFRCIVVGHY